MIKNQPVKSSILKKFVLKNLLRNLVLNIFFNGFFPYFTLRNLAGVQLFQGQYCFARFVLPMALLLPFFITFDMLKKLSTLLNKTADFVMPDQLASTGAMVKTSCIYSLLTVLVVLTAMLALKNGMPENHNYNVSFLCLLLAVLAGIMSVIFTLLPVNMFVKTISSGFDKGF